MWNDDKHESSDDPDKGFLARWLQPRRIPHYVLGLVISLALSGAKILYSEVTAPTTDRLVSQAYAMELALGKPQVLVAPSGRIARWSTGQPDGEKIVLIHGFGESGLDWLPIVFQLATRSHVTIMDLPGHGLSTGGDGPLTMDRLVDGLKAVADALDGPLTLVGHGMGGWVASEWALAHPDRVRRLVLVNTDGFPRQIDPALMLPTTRKDVRAHGRAVRGEQSPPLSRKDVVGRIDTNDAPELRALFEHLAHQAPKLSGRLGRLSTPTRLVWGSPDVFFPVDAYLPLVQADAPKGTTTTVLDGCSHGPQHSCPERLVEAILAP